MLLDKIAQALSKLDENDTVRLTSQAIEEGLDPEDIILKGLCAGMEKVGEYYEKKEYFVYDMLKASQIFNAAMSKVEPLIVGEKPSTRAKGAIGLVKGNTQDNGKNIVRIMLQAQGFEVEDLGKSVPKEKFLEAAEKGADFIGLSIMTSAGVKQAQKVTAELEKNGLRSKVKVAVGGAAVDSEKAEKIIGADGYAENAGEAVALFKQWFPF